MQARRDQFFDQIRDVPLENLVVLDESYATTKFTRLRGRARRGVRLVEHVPHGHWKTLTLLAAMSLEGVVAAAAIDAATDAEVFLSFIRHSLAPSLRPGQVVIMDNLTSHYVSGVREAIENAGCRLVYLPPYSPDYSPIEPMFSKLKQTLRSLEARTIDQLFVAIGVALNAITPSDCLGFFQHCGYTL